MSETSGYWWDPETGTSRLPFFILFHCSFMIRRTNERAKCLKVLCKPIFLWLSWDEFYLGFKLVGWLREKNMTIFYSYLLYTVYLEVHRSLITSIRLNIQINRYILIRLHADSVQLYTANDGPVKTQSGSNAFMFRKTPGIWRIATRPLGVAYG